MHNATKLETMLGSVGLVRTAQSPGVDQESTKRSGRLFKIAHFKPGHCENQIKPLVSREAAQRIC
jgi:hypothetical protein